MFLKVYHKKSAECYKFNSNVYNFHVVFLSVFQFKTSCDNFFNVLQCIIAHKKYENPSTHTSYKKP